jgi:hypothetical protein
MKSIKVRFNLSRGVNYLKWKVEYPDGNVMYYYPTGVQLIMGDCTLKNYKKVAEKIHNVQINPYVLGFYVRHWN